MDDAPRHQKAIAILQVITKVSTGALFLGFFSAYTPDFLWPDTRAPLLYRLIVTSLAGLGGTTMIVAAALWRHLEGDTADVRGVGWITKKDFRLLILAFVVGALVVTFFLVAFGRNVAEFLSGAPL